MASKNIGRTIHSIYTVSVLIEDVKLGGINIVSRLKLALILLMAMIIVTGCSSLDAKQALQFVVEAKSYYAEYSYNGFEGKTVSVEEWYLAPNNLYQQISYDGAIRQRVWVHKGQTTILNDELDDVFIIQREVASQLLQLYQEATGKVTMRKEEDHYLLSAESAEGLEIIIKCNKKGQPLLIQANSDKLEKNYTIINFDVNCRIKESIFKKGTD